MRNILRTVAGVVIFLTGYFYIFGKSMKDVRPKPNRLRLGRSWCMNMPGNKYPSQGPHMRRLMPVTKSLPIVIFQET
jgi:hypothetical protein